MARTENILKIEEEQVRVIEIVVGVLIGLIGGVAVGIQNPLSGVVSERVGGASSSLIIHVSGAIASGLLLLVRGGERIQNWRSLPWYMLTIGVFGVILFLTLSYTIPRLGATAALTLVIVGQLSTAVLIDNFGWFGITARSLDATRLVAIALLLAGAYLIVK